MALAQRLLTNVPSPMISMMLPADPAPGVQSKEQQFMTVPQQSSMKASGRSISSEGPVVMQEHREVVTTTAMLRNIPFKYNEMELALELEELGLKGKYDLLYLPKQAKGNIGYAFVNLKTPEFYEQFKTSLHRYRFKRYQDGFRKKASVSVAACQGYQANVERITKLGEKLPGLIL